MPNLKRAAQRRRRRRRGREAGKEGAYPQNPKVMRMKLVRPTSAHTHLRPELSSRSLTLSKPHTSRGKRIITKKLAWSHLDVQQGLIVRGIFNICFLHAINKIRQPLPGVEDTPMKNRDRYFFF